MSITRDQEAHFKRLLLRFISSLKASRQEPEQYLAVDFLRTKIAPHRLHDFGASSLALVMLPPTSSCVFASYVFP
jgi:hypothetical protein